MWRWHAYHCTDRALKGGWHGARRCFSDSVGKTVSSILCFCRIRSPSNTQASELRRSERVLFSNWGFQDIQFSVRFVTNTSANLSQVVGPFQKTAYHITISVKSQICPASTSQTTLMLKDEDDWLTDWLTVRLHKLQRWHVWLLLWDELIWLSMWTALIHHKPANSCWGWVEGKNPYLHATFLLSYFCKKWRHLVFFVVSSIISRPLGLEWSP